MQQTATTPVIQRQIAEMVADLERQFEAARARGDTDAATTLAKSIRPTLRTLAELGTDPLVVPGYTLVRPISGGRSGALIFDARPTPGTLRRFAQLGRDGPRRVIAKYVPYQRQLGLIHSGAIVLLGRTGDILDLVKIGERGRVLIMPRHPGPTLADACRALHDAQPQGLDLHALARVVGWVSSASEEAARLHRAGVHHGKLHAGNFIARPDGAVKVIDFDWAGELPAAESVRAFFRRVEAADLGAMGQQLVTGRPCPMLRDAWQPPTRGIPLGSWPRWVPANLRDAIDAACHAEIADPLTFAETLTAIAADWGTP